MDFKKVNSSCELIRSASQEEGVWKVWGVHTRSWGWGSKGRGDVGLAKPWFCLFWAYILSFPPLKVLGHFRNLSWTRYHAKVILRLLLSSSVGCATRVPTSCPSSLPRGPFLRVGRPRWASGSSKLQRAPFPRLIARLRGVAGRGTSPQMCQGLNPNMPAQIAGRPWANLFRFPGLRVFDIQSGFWGEDSERWMWRYAGKVAWPFYFDYYSFAWHFKYKGGHVA